MTSPLTPASSEVYYTGNYWNNRPEVIAYLNRRATGDPATAWWGHLAARHGRPFERVLAFNCGDGWVERDLINQGVARSAIGVDIGADLLASARASAAAAGMDITYIEADTNRFEFDVEGIDCVVNYAAGHHVAAIDRVFRKIAGLLGPQGVFVSWDYTGPHRNQYPAAQWEAIFELNESLPGSLRKTLTYPHLPTMLVTDPTEAVHSELILPVMRRYFDFEHLRHLGGGLAYEVLTFNDAFFDPGIDTSAEIARILAADEAYTDEDPEGRSLFTYVIARPKPPERWPTPEQLTAWTVEEEERERTAGVDGGGRYQPDTLIGHLTERIEVLERNVEAHRAAQVPVAAGRGPVERVGRRLDDLARPFARRIRPAIARARGRATPPPPG